MNGKMAKLLRKLGKDNKSSKRTFDGLDAVTKGKLRAMVNEIDSEIATLAQDNKLTVGVDTNE